MGDAQLNEPIVPVRFSAKQLAGKDLEPGRFLTPKVRGNPSEFISPAAEEPRMAVSFTGDITSFVYETGPVKFRPENTLYDEFIQVLEAAIIFTPDAPGETHEFRAGDSLVLPKGFTGIAETIGERFRELVIVETETFSEDEAADYRASHSIRSHFERNDETVNSSTFLIPGHAPYPPMISLRAATSRSPSPAFVPASSVSSRSFQSETSKSRPS